MEGVLVLHEALNSIHIKKQSVMLFKVDFEKDDDKSKWPFVHKILNLEGFPDKWNDWITETARGGCVSIKVNDSLGPYFPTFKGLRQGDS